MRRNTLTLEQKIWLMISFGVILTVSFSSFLLDYFYQKLYVDKVEQTLRQEGKALASDYHGGAVSETFRKQIE